MELWLWMFSGAIGFGCLVELWLWMFSGAMALDV